MFVFFSFALFYFASLLTFKSKYQINALHFFLLQHVFIDRILLFCFYQNMFQIVNFFFSMRFENWSLLLAFKKSR